MTIATGTGKSCFFLVLLIIAVVACGCMDGGSVPHPVVLVVNDSSSPALPGFITTPETPPGPPGIAVLITPNESNTPPVHITPTPPARTYLFPIEEAPQLPIQPLYVPTLIPPGFSYQGGSLDSEGVVQLRLTNQTQVITYIQAPNWGDPGGSLMGPGAGYRQIHSGNVTFMCSETESLHQLVWRDDAHDYYLIGGLGCEELLRMAKSLVPLDYALLDQLPYQVSDPENPFPNPEKIRLILPLAWVKDRYPDKYHSRIYDITLTSAEFNASFAPDPMDPEILRYVDVKENETVLYLSLPDKLFEQFSKEPGMVRIRYPKDYFVSFANMESLYEAHWKDPPPPGWKPRNPGITGTKPVTPVTKPWTG